MQEYQQVPPSVYFFLTNEDALKEILNLRNSIKNWGNVAIKYHFQKSEQVRMAKVF
jgi:hypothetical protein